MVFSESSNFSHLMFSGDTYHLNIKTKYRLNDGEHPDIIYLNITIVKMIVQNKYQVDTLELIYTLKTRTYSPYQIVNSLGHILYESIIKMLDETYSIIWGCEIQ